MKNYSTYLLLAGTLFATTCFSQPTLQPNDFRIGIYEFPVSYVNPSNPYNTPCDIQTSATFVSGIYTYPSSPLNA